MTEKGRREMTQVQQRAIDLILGAGRKNDKSPSAKGSWPKQKTLCKEMIPRMYPYGKAPDCSWEDWHQHQIEEAENDFEWNRQTENKEESL